MNEDIQITIHEEKGQVVLGFSRPTNEVKIPPETARGIAEEIAKKAFKGSFGHLPANTKMLSEQKRATLVKRTEHILKRLVKKNRGFTHSAETIVDAILQEVL